MSDIHIYFLIK